MTALPQCFGLLRAFRDGFEALDKGELGTAELLERVTERKEGTEQPRARCVALAEPGRLMWQESRAGGGCPGGGGSLR